MAKKTTFGFDKLKKAFNDVVESGNEIVEEIQQELLEEEATYIQSAIRAQEFDHEPLNPGYLVRKIFKGLDPRILMATTEYIDKIGVYEDPSGSRYVGIPDEKHEPPEGGGPAVDLKDLAKWLEFGTIKMPARPHFGPVHRRMMIRLPFRLAQAGFKTVKGRQRRGEPAR